MGLEPGLCFSTLVHAGKMGSGSKSVNNHFVFCLFERSQTGPKGVWNLSSAFPLWSMLEKCGQVPSPFLTQIRPFHFEQGQTSPEGVWSLTSAFPLWSMLDKMGSSSKPFRNQFGPVHFERGHAGSKWVWNLASAFPLWCLDTIHENTSARFPSDWVP